MSDRMRLTPTGPMAFVQWNTTSRAFYQSTSEKGPWSRIVAGGLSDSVRDALEEIKAEAETESPWSAT